MSNDDRDRLAAIKARCSRDLTRGSAWDVPWLIAEIESLRGEVRHYQECDGDHYDLIRENERLRGDNASLRALSGLESSSNE